MFEIVFHDSSLYLKQLHLFCLLWLISASADRSGYITNFCSMVKLTVARAQKQQLLKHRSIQAFDDVVAGKKEN